MRTEQRKSGGGARGLASVLALLVVGAGLAGVTPDVAAQTEPTEILLVGNHDESWN